MYLVLAVRVQGTPLIFGIPLAFLGGFLSFVSPCVLPLVPGYFGYLAGTSVAAGSAPPRRTLLLNGLAFVLGFSTIFTIFGVAIGQFLTNVQSAQGYVRWIGGVVIIILGFHTLGVIRIPFLHRTMKVQPGAGFLSRKRGGLGIVAHPPAALERVSETQMPVVERRSAIGTFGRSFLIGTFFAAGWSPCVGPILTGIYGVVGSQPANGGLLLFAYSLGLGVPFLGVALLFGKASGMLRRVNRYYGVISIVSGLFLIGIGVLLLTDTMARLAQYAPAISVPGVT
ncbi:MAG: cytochrome c biogenesis protein CcdA [Chloroflexota bacterium]|nr:cytochrome c biogenesis protein CcdA [Chloroflexota bacterium]